MILGGVAFITAALIAMPMRFGAASRSGHAVPASMSGD
jgi:hypothetical protein